MKKHLLLAILISLINQLFVAASPQSGAGNVSGAQNSSVMGQLQPAEAQADFDMMRKALEEAHSGLYRAVTHHLKRATYIGEETGGGYYGNNSGMQTVLTLPNSKARIRAPMYEYWNATPGYAGKRRGTLPDYTVQTKAANLLRGVDEQLELALKLATQAPGKN